MAERTHDASAPDGRRLGASLLGGVAMLGSDGRNGPTPSAGPTPRLSRSIGALVPGHLPPAPSRLPTRSRTFGMLRTFPPTACGLAPFSAAISDRTSTHLNSRH